MWNRRHFVASLAAGAASWPLFLDAQTVRRVGVVSTGVGAVGRRSGWRRENAVGTAFVNAMKELGHEEGRDYLYEYRGWQREEEIPALVRDLIQLKVDVIVAVSHQSVTGARRVTDRVPIVMVHSPDPVALGLVRSINRPGGNLTGLTWDHGFDTQVKSLELLRETLPAMRRVAVLWDTGDHVHGTYFKRFEEDARHLGLTIVSAGVRTAADFEQAFAGLRASKAEGLIVWPSAAIATPHREAIMALATKQRIPTIVPAGLGFSGGLLAWGPHVGDVPRRAARYVDQILKGARPGDLPIEQPSKYELIVDLKVARGLGITIPPGVLARADHVIE